jgi:hypothetical protein
MCESVRLLKKLFLSLHLILIGYIFRILYSQCNYKIYISVFSGSYNYLIYVMCYSVDVRYCCTFCEKKINEYFLKVKSLF